MTGGRGLCILFDGVSDFAFSDTMVVVKRAGCGRACGEINLLFLGITLY